MLPISHQEMKRLPQIAAGWLISKIFGTISGALLIPIPALTATITATSSNPQEQALGAMMAVDGNMSTRWSSEFDDRQWLTLDLGETEELVGLRIHWETAYGRDYDILLSGDGENWQTAAIRRDGRGGTETIYFGPKSGRYIKLQGVRRGTGWGYSVYEAVPLGEEYRRDFSATTSAPGHAPENLMDGDSETFWRPENKTSGTEIVVSLPEPVESGGVALLWGDGDRSSWSLSIRATPNDEWISVGQAFGTANPDEIFFDAQQVGEILVRFLDPTRIPEVAELTLLNANAAWNPQRHFESLAAESPDGAFPRWLSQEQVYWTIAGLPQRFEEALIDEYGNVELLPKTLTVTPALTIDGTFKTAFDFRTEQHLVEDWAPIPSVTWTSDNIELEVTLLVDALNNSHVRYTILNSGPKTRSISLMLATRSLQISPPWQYGGTSHVASASLDESGVLRVEDRDVLFPSPAPEQAVLQGQSEIPTFGLLQRDAEADTPDFENGILSAGYLYEFRLAADESASVYLSCPMEKDTSLLPDNPSEFFEDAKAFMTVFWRKETENWEIEVPDRRWENLIRSNLAYLLLNADGPAIQPGSRNYELAWIRDGSISSTSMVRFGLTTPVRDYLEWFSDNVHDNGFVPFILKPTTGEMPDYTHDWKEHDSFGQLAHAVRYYAAATGDWALAGAVWPKVDRALDYMMRLRRERLTTEYAGTEFEGILPESNSHEGYFPARHSHWDNMWGIIGLEDGAAIARALGLPERALELRREASELRQAMIRSMNMVAKEKDLTFLPATADLGDPDPSATSIALMIGHESETLPPKLLKGTYERYWRSCEERRIDKPSSYTAYELRNVAAYLRLDQPERAMALLEYFLDDAVRPAGWNHMGEVTHPGYRSPNYIGDMPHTWIGSGLIHAIADMFVYELDDSLVVGAGIPMEWYRIGCGFSGIRTLWGNASATFTTEEETPTLRLFLEKEPPGRVVGPKGVRLIVAGNG